jgi:ATP-dependent Clp protease ATP-binding subunit ClpA
MDNSTNFFDGVVNDVFAAARSSAAEKGHPTVNVARLFSSSFLSFGSYKNSDSTIAKLNNGVINVLNKYDIELKDFGPVCAGLWPSTGEAIMLDAITYDEEVISLLQIMQNNAKTENRQQNAVDLFVLLFGDRTYSLHTAFVELSKKFKTDYDNAIAEGKKESELPPVSFDVDALYDDMNKFLSTISSWGISSLESDYMKDYLTNINAKMADEGDKNLFIGMEDEVTALEVALAGRTIKSAMLVGPAGTGKTALVYELAKRIVNGQVPSFLKNVVIYELHMDAIIAGASFVGQYEQRFRNIMEPVKKLKNVIIFIDEIHTAAKQATATYSGADLLKPYLSRGDVWAIGATTDSEYNEFVAPSKALTRRFNKVIVREPNREEALQIMANVNKIDEDYFKKTFNKKLLDKMYALADDYNMEQANPAKILDMLEQAYAYARVCHENATEVTMEDVMHSLELKYAIKVYGDRLDKTSKDLHSTLLGQDAALDKVCHILSAIDLHVLNPERPRASIMLAGPTGTGKTETAKIIARDFTGSDKNLIVESGTELSEETAVNSLFGSDAGYIGYKPTSDFLTQIQSHPNCVLLFDEIEKAHPAVFRSLLNILDQGYAVDKSGNRISFRNVIIIFTTNLGFGTTNFVGNGAMFVPSDNKALQEINKHFSPEFIGRLDNIIQYERLTDAIAETLIERYRKFYATASGTDVKFSKEDIEDIKKKADIAHLGARVLDHATKDKYLDALLDSKKTTKKEAK